MLALHVHAPERRVFKLVSTRGGLLNQTDRFGVINALERCGAEFLEARDRFLVNAFNEELHVVMPLCKRGGEHGFHQAFRAVGVHLQIGKRQLGFNHPELR